MKKVLLVLMSLFLFVLVGCGSSSSNSLDINVVDLSGKPVANATVILTDTTVAMGDVFEITTDENGIASFSSLKSGVNYKMEVFVNGEKVSERSNVSTDIDFLKITLDQGEPGDDGEEEAITATLKIKVEDNNGKLVEDAKVTLDNDEKHTVVTGIVTYTDIKLGKYTVKIEKAGFDVIEEEIEVTKEAETMTFKLTVQVNKFTINYINAAEDYTDYSLEITSIDGIDKNIL
ncbi:MAG: carboxypeptidase regulatory-like domain-containing protein, partial [Fusobacteria bacterium]|nr:carboxypeptidase regulatory-like domain-containing protein [Fusobacteriota bacterium]